MGVDSLRQTLEQDSACYLPFGASQRGVPFKAESELSRVWRNFRRNRLAVLGLGVFSLILLCALSASFLPLLSPTDMDLDNEAAPPSWKHLLGTDSFGRDTLSRIVFASRISLTVGLISVGLALALGVPLGLATGFFGGWWDTVSMRFIDTLFTFPSIVLAIALMGTLGPGISNVMIALGIVYTPRFVRIVRASTLSVRESEYVYAAMMVGASNRRIMWRHILPNVSGPIIVQASASYAYAIIAEASLSFLGLGVQPPTPSWGQMLREGRLYLESAPWFPIVTGLTIVISVLGLNLLGDGLRDALDPRLWQ